MGAEATLTSKGQTTIPQSLSAVELTIEEESSVEQALYIWKDSPAQFADCLIGAHHRTKNCTATASFDGDALKLPGFVAA